MKRFDAIEGLRGWLALAVVLSHLAWMTDFPLFHGLGSMAVTIFLIISGFVVTHLILERQEPYAVYLTQRAARIFPLFAVTCLIGFFINDLVALVDLKNADFARDVHGVAESNHRHFWPHVAAHVGMIHGVIPNAVLPYSEYAFNMPAWSISLEWQFYIIAPIAALVLSRKPWLIIALAIIMVGLEMTIRKLGRPTLMPGNLVATAAYFTIGIYSRLIYIQALAFAHSIRMFSVLAVAIVLLPINDMRPFVLWGLVWLFLIKSDRGMFGRGMSFILKNPLALYFGSRSYSIYLTHYIVLSGVVYAFHRLGMPIPGIVILAVIGVPLTILISELTFRTIERPGIAFGKHMVAKPPQ